MKETNIRCDRCGKKYSLDQWPDIEFRGSSPVKLQMKAMIEDATTIEFEDVDLCVRCRSELREWWHHGLVREG